MANKSIVVCGKKFECNSRVVLWNEEAGLSFYPYNKFGARNISLGELRKLINAFYIHHSVTYTAHSMYRGLMARGLSCNFMIDDDVNEDGCATIYQCLDVKDYGYSQGGIFNHNGVGVEISYYPDAWSNPDRYSAYNRAKWGVYEHPVLPDEIHGYKFSKVFGPTEAQVQACINLIDAYRKAFPHLKLKFPRDDNGQLVNQVVPADKAFGLLQHYHVSKEKIDAAGFPHQQVEQAVNELARLDQLKRPSLFRNIFSLLKNN